MFAFGCTHPTAIKTSTSRATIAESAFSSSAKLALRDALVREQGFIRIHAGETLVALGESTAMHAFFLKETSSSDPRYLVGVWRILAQSAPNLIERSAWIARLEQSASTPGSATQLVAIESLNKLNRVLTGIPLAAVKDMMADATDASRPFLHWAEALAGNPDAIHSLVQLLQSPVPAARSRAAYALRHLKPGDRSVLTKLAAAAMRETLGTNPHIFLLSACVALDADPAQTPAWRTALSQALLNGSDAAAYEASSALTDNFPGSELPHLAELLNASAGDRQIACAKILASIHP